MTKENNVEMTPEKQEIIKEFITYIKDKYNLTLDVFTKLNDWTYRFSPLEVDLYPTKYEAYYYKRNEKKAISEVLDEIKAYLDNSVINTVTGEIKPKTLHVDEFTSEKFYTITNSEANWKRLLDAVAFVSLNPNKNSCGILKQVIFEVLRDLPREFFDYSFISESEDKNAK